MERWGKPSQRDGEPVAAQAWPPLEHRLSTWGVPGYTGGIMTVADRLSKLALAVREYDEVHKYDNASLFDPDRVGLIVALLYTGQSERAVVEAGKLWDKSLLNAVYKEIEAIYREKGKPEEGERLIRQMRPHSPPPPPMLGPMPE